MDTLKRMPPSYNQRNSWRKRERERPGSPQGRRPGAPGARWYGYQAGVTVESVRLALVHSCELSSCCSSPCRSSYHDFDKFAAMDMQVLAGSANIVTITK